MVEAWGWGWGGGTCVRDVVKHGVGWEHFVAKKKSKRSGERPVETSQKHTGRGEAEHCFKFGLHFMFFSRRHGHVFDFSYSAG